MKTDIKEFISNNQYKTLEEMQEHAKRMETELETQRKEKMQTPAPSQLSAKKFKPEETRSGG